MEKCVEGNFTRMGIRAIFVSNWRYILAYASRWLFVAVFCIAAVPKLFDVGYFASVIGAYELLPDVLLVPVAVFLPLMEIFAAIGLILRKNWGTYITTLLMLLFIGVLVYGIAQGLDIDCGCFGPDDPEHVAFHGLRTALFRDLLLLIPLSYLLFDIYYNQRRWRSIS